MGYVVSIGIALFLIGFLIDFIISCLVIHWSIEVFVIVRHTIPLEVVFSINIILLIACFLIFVLLLIDSQSRVYLSLFSIILVISTVFCIGMTSKPSLKNWINKWNNQWTNISHSMSFQLENNCCGWDNFKDRSISSCPFLSKSGCKSIVKEWIYSKFIEIFNVLILDLCVFIFSIGIIHYEASSLRKNPNSGTQSLWALMEIPPPPFGGTIHAE